MPGRSSEALKQRWAEPEFRAMMVASHEGGKERAAETQRKYWADPAYRQQQMDARCHKLSESYITEQGYVMLRYQDHVLARHGEVLEHRKVLYEKIGPGEHNCHWCPKLLTWGGMGGIHVDHLDEDRLNNDPDNLVPSCFKCNRQRGKEVGRRDGLGRFVKASC